MTELVARLPRRALAHARQPLHRDALALVANSGFTAVTGLLYWIVAAKTFSAHAVGLNSALISSMMFLAGVAGLNMPNIVVRFLPEAGRGTRRAIATCYAVTAAIAAVAATIFVAAAGSWAGTAPLAAWFVVATVAWTLFTIQDGVLTALGRAVWVPLENAGFSVAKLGLLVAAAALLPRYGVFVSWTVAVVLSVIVVNALVFGRLVRHAGDEPARTSLSLRAPELRRYLAADYAGATAWLASVNLLPVLVTAAAGATTNAYFALPWAVAFPLYAVGANVGTSLVLHGAADRAALPGLVRKSLVQGFTVLVPAVLGLTLLAPLLLSLFGAEYADHGTTLLRLLALGALPNLVLALGVSIARVERRMRSAVLALGAQAALSLGLVVPLLHATGVVGPGLAWVASQCVAAAGIVALTGPRRFGLTAQAEDLRARVGTVVSGGRARQKQGAEAVGAVLTEMPPVCRTWNTWAARTDSDVIVRFAGPRGDAQMVVKVAWSDAGARALAAHRTALAALREGAALDGFDEVLPQTLSAGVTGGRAWVIERALPGVNARGWALDGSFERALAATARGVAGLYAATGASRTIDDALLDVVVDERIARLAAVRGGPELDRLRDNLRRALLGRDALVGRSHGDLWLGNALLADDASRLTGLVDWEASRPADLPGIDVAHLLISTRGLAQGSSLGGVMRRLLSGREPLTTLEAQLLAPYAPDGGPSTRALVVLAWLQHVAQRLTQTTLHPQTRWLRRTVDPVLAGLSE